MLKVAFVGQPWEPMVPPVEAGSIPIWTYQVAQRCKALCEITCYAPNFGQQPAVEHVDGIEYRRVPVAGDERRGKVLRLIERGLRFPRPKLPLYASRFFYPNYIDSVARDIGQQQCDIVHIANFSQFVPVVRAHNPDAKIVLHMHCEWLVQLNRSAIEQRLAMTDLVIGVSDHITNQIRTRFPQYADRCRTVHNAVDVARFTETQAPSEPYVPEPPRLLYVGRVSPEKGVHVLLDAFCLIARENPDVQLDIVGHVGSAPYEYMVLVSDDPHVNGLDEFYDGGLRRSDYGAHLQRRIPAELADRIHLVGQVSHSTTVDYFHHAALLVNPSLTEAFGMTLVEAMAVGTPVVATRVGGMVEIIEQSGGGRLVPPNDAEALAAAILELLSDQEQYAALCRAGRTAIPAQFTWEQTARALVNAYRGLGFGEQLEQLPADGVDAYIENKTAA